MSAVPDPTRGGDSEGRFGGLSALGAGWAGGYGGSRVGGGGETGAAEAEGEGENGSEVRGTKELMSAVPAKRWAGRAIIGGGGSGAGAGAQGDAVFVGGTAAGEGGDTGGRAFSSMGCRATWAASSRKLCA